MAISPLLFLFALFLESPLAADPSPSFSFSRFGNDSGFAFDIVLLGGAEVVNGGSAVRLTSGEANSSAGGVMYRKPIKLEDSSLKKVSFATYFSFSISPENGDGLAFSLVPADFPVGVFDGGSFGLSPGIRDSKHKILAVEFDTQTDYKVSDVNGNHVGIDMGNTLVSVRYRNVSSLNLTLNSGERLHSWIDYEAGSSRLEVRLSKSGNGKPDNPILSYYPIDLSEVWKQGEVLVGLSSSNGNSSQTCSLYSWSFKLRTIPHWLHSQPFLPGAKPNPVINEKRSPYVLRFLAAVIFGTGCGALIAFFVLFVWTVFGDRGRLVEPEEITVRTKEHGYKKIKVIVNREAMKDGGK